MKGSTARRSDAVPPGEKATPSGRAASTGRKPSSRAATSDWLWEWTKSIAVALVLFLVIRTFLIQAYTIPSGSMEDTLLVGDYLMANNAIYGTPVPFTDFRTPAFRDPRHGDIVVFRPHYNVPEIDVVKRIIGEPGDTIEMIDRVVYRNGEPLEEPYVDDEYTPNEPIPFRGEGNCLTQGVDSRQCGYFWHLNAVPAGVDRESYRPTRDTWGPLVVPEAHYLLLGDNRDQSLDSRYMGFIPRDVIRGKAMFIYYSIDPMVERPFPRLLTAARWGRIGTIIR